MAKKINFFNEGTSIRVNNKRALRAWLAKAILSCKKDFTEINIIFCSDKYLLKINRDFLLHNDYTDVITFSIGTKDLLAGDIFISLERVRENAGIFNETFKDELSRVMIHGVLHMMGYRDKGRADKAVMRRMENKILSLRTF